MTTAKFHAMKMALADAATNRRANWGATGPRELAIFHIGYMEALAGVADRHPEVVEELHRELMADDATPKEIR